jgi:NTP pyrophosphatase (non-canonical NTP hydrolase)
MNFEEYTEAVKRTVAKCDSPFEDRLHMAIGISTEAGELLDAFKKQLAYGKEIDYVNVMEEVGDLFWYIANLMRMLDINFQDTLQINIDKLRIRYPDKFSEDRALNRDLKKEREILEQLGTISTE